MILNSGLDNACTSSAIGGSGTAPNQSYPPFCQFIQYAAFGTGSTEPSPEQTTLDAQVGSRTNDRGGFANNEDGGLDAENNRIWYEATFTRVFSISSNVNATEWGLAPATTGPLSVRELFRADPLDNNSSPITLTLETGDELQLVITFRIEAHWGYESKTFTISGTAGNDTNGAHTGNATVSTGTSTAVNGIRDALQAVWPGGVASTPSYLHVIMSDQSARGVADDLSNSSANVFMNNAAYTPGSFYRDCVGVLSTSTANGDHYAWAVTPTTSPSQVSRGYRFILINPATLTKASTHRLTLTIRKGISRL